MGIRTVLVHTAVGSPEATLVVAAARGLAGLGVKKIVFACVLDASGLEGPVIMAKVDRTMADLRGLAAPLEGAGLEVECRVPTGEAEHELLSIAAEDGVDAILSGTHGKSSVERLLIGSVSEALCAQASVPNVVVRFDHMREAEDPSRLLSGFAERLLVPTDFSDAADRALDAAIEFAARADGRVVLVHVGTTRDAGARLRERSERGAAEGVDAVYVMREGGVAETLLAEAAEQGATGIVMGTRGVGSAWGELVLGSLSLTLLREADVPLMIVP